VDVSEGTSYLFFTKGTADGLNCRTKDEITVTRNETTTQTMTNTTVVVDLNDTANEAPLGTIARRVTRLTISNQSSVTLVDVKWGNEVVSASLAPSESKTLDVSEGTSYLYFTKGTADGLKCRTQEVIAVARNETTTQTMTNTTVVVDLDDTANEAPLGTIARRETKLTIRNQSSVTLIDVKWGNTVVSASLAPAESTTVDDTEGTGYLYFTKGSADGLKCRTQEVIAVARNETKTQTMTNTTVVVDLNDPANEAPMGTIAPTAVLTWIGDWTRVSDNKYQSNPIGHSAKTLEQLDITASGAGTITIRFTASCANNDSGFAYILDSQLRYMEVSGTSIKTHTYTIPSGYHFIQFTYEKDSSVISDSDSVTVEIFSTTFALK
jgi:hypothetical protein